MWIEGVLDVAKYVSEQIGGEHVFCGVSAIIVLLFLKKVLLFPNAMATIVMFAASAFFLFDHPYSYLIANNSSELIIPLVWFSEISILVALKSVLLDVLLYNIYRLDILHLITYIHKQVYLHLLLLKKIHNFYNFHSFITLLSFQTL